MFGRFTRRPIDWHTTCRRCAKCDAAKRRIRKERSTPAVPPAAVHAGSDSGGSESDCHSDAASECSAASDISAASCDSAYVGGGAALGAAVAGPPGTQQMGQNKIFTSQYTVQFVDGEIGLSLAELEVEESLGQAAQAGVQPGDELLAVGGEQPTGVDHAVALFGSKSRPVSCTFLRVSNDEFEGHYPLHQGPCSANWTSCGKLGRDGGVPPSTHAGGMERFGIVNMINRGVERKFLVGDLCADDDLKLMAWVKDASRIPAKYTKNVRKKGDCNHRTKNVSSCAFSKVSGFRGKVPGVDVISNAGAKLLKRNLSAAMRSYKSKVSDAELKGRMVQVVEHLCGEHEPHTLTVVSYGKGGEAKEHVLEAPGCDEESCQFLQAQKAGTIEQYRTELKARRKGTFGQHNNGDMTRAVGNAILADWASKGYLDRVGDINVDMDTQPVEAGHKGIARVLPKDGTDYSRTRSMAQRVDLRMCESVSPYSDNERMLVHLDVMQKLLGYRGTHCKEALLRRSMRDARKANQRRRPEAIEARRNIQLSCGVATAAAAAPAAAATAAGVGAPAPAPPSRPISRVRIESPPKRITRRRLSRVARASAAARGNSS